MSDAAPEVHFGENYRTCQVYHRGFEFAFMSLVEGVYEQTCTFVYCKDFLHDAVWAFLNQQPVEIWDFRYTPGTDKPLDLERCALTFRNTLYQEIEADFHGQLEGCREFLNQLEQRMGFEPSQLYPVAHEGSPCWLIVGDRKWLHAPPLLGLYTLFIRLGFFHRAGEEVDKTLEKARNGEITIGEDDQYAGNRDCGYIQQAWSGIQVLLQHGVDVFHPEMRDNYPKTLIDNRLHDDFGPVNFTLRRPAEVMPYWYRDEVWKTSE